MGKTHHEKIRIGKVRECDFFTTMYMIEKPEEILQETDTQKFKKLIKEFVTEYRLSQSTATPVSGNEMNKSIKKYPIFNSTTH